MLLKSLLLRDCMNVECKTVIGKEICHTLAGKQYQKCFSVISSKTNNDDEMEKRIRRLSNAAITSHRHPKAIAKKNILPHHSKQLHDISLNALQQAEFLRRSQQEKLRKLNQRLTKSLNEKVERIKNFLITETPTVKDFTNIPGPKGLPLLGSVLEYTPLGQFSPLEFNKALQSRHQRYGPIFRERLLRDEFLYISDPKDIRVLVHNEGTAPCRPHLDAIVQGRKQEGLPVGITALQGEKWLRNRNAINPAMTIPNVVKRYRGTQSEIAKDFIDVIKTVRCGKTGEVSGFDEMLNRWALESIAVVLLDSRLGLLKKKVDPAAESLRKCMDVFFDYGARLTFGVPLWKLWNTKDWKIFCQSQKDEFKYAGYFVEKKFKELKKERKQYPSEKLPTGCPMKSHQQQQGKKTKSRSSFSCLLDHVTKNTTMSQKDALTVCLELLAGGIDTTKTAAVFTLYHLSVNTKHQNHLRELLRAENTTLSFDEHNAERSEFSKYLKACIWEAMRLNPLTYANMRKTEKDLVLSGYKVPAGTTVRYTSHLMNLQDDKYFPKPKNFIPDRWLDRASPYRCKEQFTFTPFGHGARQCPGRRVAEQELDLLFREILSNFEVNYKHGEMGTKVRLFNAADKPADFSFTPLNS